MISEKTRRARWIEDEALQLNKMGFSLRAIADQITRIARSEAQPLNPVPAGVTFPPDYSISHEAVSKRIKQALARAPALAAEELRKIDHARAEEMFLTLQPAIRKGSLRAVEVGLKVLDHSARVNGYAAPKRHELTGKDGKPLTLVQLLEAVGPLSEDEDQSEKKDDNEK